MKDTISGDEPTPKERELAQRLAKVMTVGIGCEPEMTCKPLKTCAIHCGSMSCPIFEN